MRRSIPGVPASAASSAPGAAPALAALLAIAALPAAPAAAQQGGDGPADGWQLSWGLEAKAHYRDSDDNRFRSPFPFPPNFLPPGQTAGFLETVNEGNHFEVSIVSLYLGAALGEGIEARAKIDVIDLHDRNPTSGDRTIDVDEAWLRFGRETDPGRIPDRSATYLKVGKFPAFERQDDRHLESYGLVSTAFNRFEDAGVEVGADLGRFLYVKASATQGNPLFIRDPNALAGDNGLEEVAGEPIENPDPLLKTGIPILYDAEVEDLDLDGDLELGAGIGLRFGDPAGRWSVDALAWARQRELAETVALEGTLYGGDLDLLRGPFNLTPLPISGNDKEEVGLNLWLYYQGFSLFGQLVDQEVAGLDRSGWELELAWSFDLPLRWAVGGRQLFPHVAPALRYSKLDPDFDGGSPAFPAVSVRWEWEKVDYGVRLGVVDGVDLTLEYAANTFVTANGDGTNDELLTTLRWKI